MCVCLCVCVLAKITDVLIVEAVKGTHIRFGEDSELDERTPL